MGRITGQNDDTARRVRFHLIAVELVAQADVKDTRYYCVDSILRVSVWHYLHAGWHSHSDRIGAGLFRLTESEAPVGLFIESKVVNVSDWFSLGWFVIVYVKKTFAPANELTSPTQTAASATTPAATAPAAPATTSAG